MCQFQIDAANEIVIVLPEPTSFPVVPAPALEPTQADEVDSEHAPARICEDRL
jgi:hypothetical protein